jgi:phage terminase large subunit GpA-like protein
VWHEGMIPEDGLTASQKGDSSGWTPKSVGDTYSDVVPGAKGGCQGRWKTSDFGYQECPHCGEMCHPRVHWDGSVIGG